MKAETSTDYEFVNECFKTEQKIWFSREEAKQLFKRCSNLSREKGNYQF